MIYNFQVGYFPSPCGAESISSRLDEKTLLRHCSSFNPKKRPQDHFKYLVVENSTLLALLEEPLGNDQGPPSSIKSNIFLTILFNFHIEYIEIAYTFHDRIF